MTRDTPAKSTQIHFVDLFKDILEMPLLGGMEHCGTNANMWPIPPSPTHTLCVRVASTIQTNAYKDVNIRSPKVEIRLSRACITHARILYHACMTHMHTHTHAQTPHTHTYTYVHTRTHTSAAQLRTYIRTHIHAHAC